MEDDAPVALGQARRPPRAGADGLGAQLHVRACPIMAVEPSNTATLPERLWANSWAFCSGLGGFNHGGSFATGKPSRTM